MVQNQGNEISDNEKEKIFKPFYQSDDSRSKIKWNGVGLGLSIVNIVIEKHGGEIKVISRNNHTAFICWLPN
jgi:signal transduction histidine kinase